MGGYGVIVAPCFVIDARTHVFFLLTIQTNAFHDRIVAGHTEVSCCINFPTIETIFVDTGP
jgi:hypothetical protein